MNTTSCKQYILSLALTVLSYTALCTQAIYVHASPDNNSANNTAQTAPSTKRASSAVIYDTDMAIDDWFALVFLAKHPQIELKAVTVSASGESRCKPAKNNVQSLLDLSAAKQNIMVACGDAYALDGYFVFPEPWRVGADTLSGVTVASSRRSSSDKHAVDIIHQVVKYSTKPVTVVAVGPLTNIAQWLQRYPGDGHNVEQLVIMGGTLEAKGNIIVPEFTDDHPNKTAEWNFFIDPMAAKIVLSSGLPIKLIGLDVTNNMRVTSAYAATFKTLAQHTPATKFVDAVFTANDWFIASNEYYFWDVLAAMTVVSPDLCAPESTPITVAYEPLEKPAYVKTSDLSMPNTRWDGQKRRHINAATAGTLARAKKGPKIDVCMQTNAKKAFKLFSDTMAAL